MMKLCSRVMAFRWLLFMALFLLYKTYQGASTCTMGFPSATSLSDCFADVSQCHSTSPSLYNTYRRVLYLQMKITCNGAVVGWTAASGEAFSPWSTNPYLNTILSFWRERDGESQTYDRVGAIILGFCGIRLAVRGVFECMLPQDSRVSVRAGDIIGVEVAIDLDLGFQILYRRKATEIRLRAHLFDIRRRSSTVRLNDSIVLLTDEPQISLSVEPAANQTMTTIHTDTAILPTNFTSQRGSNTAAKIVGAVAVGVVFLITVIVVCAIKRHRKTSNSKRIGKVNIKRVEANQMQKSKDMEVNKHRDTQILKLNGATYGQQRKKYVIQRERNNFMVNRSCEQVPPEKPQCKKGNAPAINISNDHKCSASSGLYACPVPTSSSAKVQHCSRSGTRYKNLTISGQEEVVDGKAGFEKEAVDNKETTVAVYYDKAVVYEKAAIYETAAIYEQAVTYERVVMYEKAPPAVTSYYLETEAQN